MSSSLPEVKLIRNAIATDGRRPFTADQSMGNNKLTSLGAPTDPSDAARLQDVQTLARKEAVLVATTGNITLSGAQTIDGVALTGGERVLVKDQTTASENGIYTVVDPGAWTRTADANTAESLNGAIVFVDQGGTNQDSNYQQVNTLTTLADPQSWVNAGSDSDSTPTSLNKDMVCNVTSVDGDQVTAITMGASPAGGSHVAAEIDGIGVSVSSGDKTGVIFISGDGGTTARTFATIQPGDTIHINPTVLGATTDATDTISLFYSV